MATTKTPAKPAAKPAAKSPAQAASAKATSAKTVAKPATKAPVKRATTKVAAKPAAVTPVVDGDACALPGAAVDAPKKRYRLLTGPDDSNFCQKVSDALDDGYELYGSPSITFNGKTAYAAQAVILKKLPKGKKAKKK